MPRKKKHEKYIRVLAFDPSTKIAGYSILDYDINSDMIYLYKTGKITRAELLKDKDLLKDNEHFDKSFTVIEGIGNHVKKLLDEYKPAYVVSESAFAGSFIQALIVISSVITKIRHMCKLYNNRDLYMVAPKQTKSEITGDHNADKVKLRECLVTNRKLKLIIPKSINLDKLTLDETDAIGHGVTFIRQQLPTLILENSKHSGK